MNKTNLYCPICESYLSLDEKVYLDIMNTVSHEGCDYRVSVKKDSGTLEEIINKYPFFENALIH